MKTNRHQPGLSLVEVVVVIGLLGMIGVVIGSTLLHQQRFTSDASELLRVRGGVRDAMEVVSTDIRGLSSADTLRVMADSAVELFATIGTSVVCSSLSSDAVSLAEESVGGNTLSGFLLHPDTGDIALLYVDGADGTAGRWEGHRIAVFEARTSASGCLAEGGNPKEGFALTLQSTTIGSVKRGTPVRFLRRGRYSLYRSSDREWYLGYRRCNALGASSCGAIQPVSGPYRSYSADPAETGFLFEYFDGQGKRVTAGDSPLSVARIDVTARARGPQRRIIRGAARAIADSATASIALRNRP